MEKLIPLLEQLAQKLGVTADMLWSALLKQSRLYAIYYLIMFVFLAGLSIVFWRWLRWTAKNWAEIEGNNNDIPHVVGLFALGIILLVGWLVLLCDGNTVLAALFNPEYWALNKILSVISN